MNDLINSQIQEVPFYLKYKVLIILFLYLLILSYLTSFYENSNFMLNLMGFFFIIFSFFKVIHLIKFKDSFSKYDLIGKLIPFYGYLYPFLELVLGILFLINLHINIISIITIIILSSTTIGIILSLRNGEILECACLGTVFNLPLSNVTIFENVIMIIMAIINLL